MRRLKLLILSVLVLTTAHVQAQDYPISIAVGDEWADGGGYVVKYNINSSTSNFPNAPAKD